MIDKGDFVHHMMHPTTSAYNSDGISYTGGTAYTSLRPEPAAAFKFPPQFFMQIYVKVRSDFGAPEYQLIFAKKRPGKNFWWRFGWGIYNN